MCVLVGYSSIKKGYKLYSIDKKIMIYSRNVKFYENIFPFEIKASGQELVVSENKKIV